jgi:hypothetical protein
MLRITQGETRPLFVALRCGGCGHPFEANARTVPVFAGALEQAPPRPACRACWDRVNTLRVRANLAPWGRPACYPEDYPPEVGGTAPASPAAPAAVRRAVLPPGVG